MSFSLFVQIPNGEIVYFRGRRRWQEHDTIDIRHTQITEHCYRLHHRSRREMRFLWILLYICSGLFLFWFWSRAQARRHEHEHTRCTATAGNGLRQVNRKITDKIEKKNENDFDSKTTVQLSSFCRAREFLFHRRAHLHKTTINYDVDDEKRASAAILWRMHSFVASTKYSIFIFGTAFSSSPQISIGAHENLVTSAPIERVDAVCGFLFFSPIRLMNLMMLSIEFYYYFFL